MSIEDAIRNAVVVAVREALVARPQIANAARLLTTKVAAEYLACSADEIRNLVAKGQLSPVPLSEHSGKWRFDRRDLDVLIERNKSTGVPQ
jgi:excisionase family DNA binding protein